MKRFNFKDVASVAGLSLCVAFVGASASQARSAPAPNQATLQVFAAASLSDAFTEIGRKLEQLRPGLTVRLNFDRVQVHFRDLRIIFHQRRDAQQ